MPRSDGRIEPGQRLRSAISASAWNRAQQAADIVLGATPGYSAESASFAGAPYIWVYGKLTNYASAVERWSVLKITDLEITPTSTPSDRATTQFEQMPVLQVEPAEEDGAQTKACVALEPLTPGSIGRVAVSGVVQVKAFDVPKLGAGSVLWREGYWALVRFGGSPVRLAKTTDAWPRGESATVQLWESGVFPDEEITSPVTTVTAYNKFYDVAACVWVLIAQSANGSWYLVEAATPDPSGSGCKAPNIGGHDLTTVSGYASNKKQALTHDQNACLKWVDIEDCS